MVMKIKLAVFVVVVVVVVVVDLLLKSSRESTAVNLDQGIN